MKTTKSDIKLRALQMFNENGIDRVGMRDIANEMGISPGNLTYHFPSRNDIVFALCHDLIDAVNATLSKLDAQPDGANPLVFFYEQCREIGQIQLQYRFLFEKRYAEILTSFPEIQAYYQQVLKTRFAVYRELHRTLVRKGLAAPALLRETIAIGYLINIVGLFWHQETAIYFPHYTDGQRLAHSLTVFFHIYKPYLTKKGWAMLRPYMMSLPAY